ncbi:hypothetical protein [Nocardioides montaniterrae]
MGAVAATASCGRAGVRGGRTARTACRLLVLLGLSFVAVLLLGSSANAKDCDRPSCEAAPAARPGLVHGLLDLTGSLLHPLLAHASDAHQATPVPTPHVPAAHGPASTLTHHVTAPLASTLATTTPAAAQPSQGEPVRLPSLHDALAPVLGAAAQAADGAVDMVADATAPLPVVGSMTALLRDTGTAVVDAVGSSVSSLGTSLDTTLGQASVALGTVLAPLAGGRAGTPTVGSPTGASSPAGAGTSSVDSPAAHLSDLLVLGARPGLAAGSPGAFAALDGPAAGVPSAPPETAGAVLAAQSAPGIVTASAVPVPGAVGAAAGSTPGPASSGSTGSHELTQVAGTFAFRAVMVIGSPAVTVAGPRPGTPLVDPGFSPD